MNLSSPPQAEMTGSTMAELTRVVQDRAARRDDRLAAGVRLAAAGDSRAGVLTLEPAWCLVPAGPFVIGADPDHDPESFDREAPRHQLTLPAYRVSRYPVTNGQWQRFVAAGGYAEPQWWLATGWAARLRGAWDAPRTWHDSTWPGNEANRPVVGVSWYEALAYAAWMTSCLHYHVDVCTEPEWEKAARGVDGRVYPFGDALDPEAVHVSVSAGVPPSPAPAPVGCYPRGASPWGAEDMVGNTYSWTRSLWGAAESAPAFTYPYVAADGREALDSGDYRVVRGGAWSFPVRNARCSYRGKDRPEEAFNNVGVRLVTRHHPSSPRHASGAGQEQAS